MPRALAMISPPWNSGRHDRISDRIRQRHLHLGHDDPPRALKTTRSPDFARAQPGLQRLAVWIVAQRCHKLC